METDSIDDRDSDRKENEEELERVPAKIELPKETLDYFNGDELRARVFYEKYALKDPSGVIVELTPVDMWTRVARELASVEATEEKREEWGKKFYWLLENFRFVPGGRIMFGAGQPRRSTLLNCYYLPIKNDSLESIFEFCKEAGRTYSYGGGVGTDISILRPRGAPVNNSAVVSTGSVSFMELFSVTTGTIGQAGRRGALMITIHVDHPDVMDFINVKRDTSKVTHANISVCITDKFMRAVENDEKFELSFNNEKAHVSRFVRARELWDKLVSSAHASAEPGIIFWDNVKNESPTEYNGMEVHGFNPCLAADTYLQTQHGLSQISELQTRSDFLAVDSGEPTLVKKVWQTGVKEVFRLRTSLGYYLDATANHQLMSRTGPDLIPSEDRILSILKLQWKNLREIGKDSGFKSRAIISRTIKSLNRKGLVEIKQEFTRRSPKPIREIFARLTPEAGSPNRFEWEELGSLKIGDKLLMSMKEGMFPVNYLSLPEFAQTPSTRNRSRKVFTFPSKLDESLAGLLGWIVTDGMSIPTRRKTNNRLVDLDQQRISIISLNDDEDSDIRRVVKSTFGLEPTGGNWRKTKAVKGWHVQGQNLKSFIGYFGLNCDHEEARVPQQILKSPKTVVAAFLRRVFEGDGWCTRTTVTLVSLSLELVATVQQLLLKFGIIAQVRTTKRTKPRSDIHVLTIGDLGSLDIFAREIGFVTNATQAKLVAAIACKSRNLKYGKSSKYRWVDYSHIETPITSIESLGVQPVYDCSTSTHSFTANGFVVHNCSEQCLEDYGCCCLGNINLAAFVVDEFSDKASVDWRHLEKAVRYATRFLDNVLEYNNDKHPLPEQTRASLWSRRIGVGFTGLADMLIKLNLKYDTAPAIKFVDRTLERIKNVCYDESTNLAKEKGPAPGFDVEKHTARQFVTRLSSNVKDKIKTQGLRNCCLLTVPPVGSGAILAGTTSGIEPIFALSYVRRTDSLSGNEFKVYHPLVQDYMRRFNLSSEAALPDTFVTAHKIKADSRVQMQGTIQKHVDSSISSTVNISKETTVEEVKRIYVQAWKSGCKGITVYREGAREGILLTEEEAARQKGNRVGTKKEDTYVRSKVLTGQTIKMKLPQGNLYVTANKNGDEIIRETFVTLGKSGGDEKADAEAIGRLISLFLQHGGNVQDVIHSLKGIQARDVSWDNGQQLLSVPDAVAKALENLTGTIVELEPELKHCPDCAQSSIIFENGCYRCTSCGYSKCN